MLAQITWVKIQYPQITIFSTNILGRTGFDGDITYYFDHMDLFKDKFLLNIPSWHTLLVLGVLAVVIVISLIQRRGASLSQQTVLISMIGLYILFAFVLSNTTVIHVYNYGNYLAIPVIVALFALLPAWLEILFIRMKYMFVTLSVIVAFATSGLQLLAYWLQMPPLLSI